MPKTKISAVIVTFVLCMAFWVLLTWNFSSGELTAGALVSLAAALFASRFMVHENAFHLLNPAKLFGLIYYVLVVFPVELIKANVDVAKRCFGGCKNINPGIVKVPVDVESEYGQAMLANSITLTPGTITVDINDDVMLVHCVDKSYGEGLEDSDMEHRVMKVEEGGKRHG